MSVVCCLLFVGCCVWLCLAVRCSLCVVRCLLCVVSRLSFVGCCSLRVVCCLVFADGWLMLGVCRCLLFVCWLRGLSCLLCLVCVVCCSLFVVCRVLCDVGCLLLCAVC